MTDVTIPTDNSIRKKEHEKLKKYHGLKRGARDDVGGEGKSGGWNAWGCDLQARRVGPTHSRNNVCMSH